METVQKYMNNVRKLFLPSKNLFSKENCTDSFLIEIKSSRSFQTIHSHEALA